MKKPNEFIEVFMSLIKLFFIVLIVNNLIWAGVFVVATSSEETVTTNNELNQSGHDNNQELTNG